MKYHLPYCQRLLVASLSITLSFNASAQQKTTDNDELEHLEIRHHKQPYRGDVPLKSTPQAVSVVSGELLQDAGIVDFQNALDFSSGIVRQNSFGGMWDSFAIRGFAGDENLPSGYLVNGFSAGRGYSGRRDTSNVQSIEILKGPGSALYGRSEPGGTINIITKKPQFFEEGYIQASVGNYDTYRVEGDYTNAITSDLAFRINGSYQDAGSFRDTVQSKKLSVTPSVLYKISENTSVSYEVEVLDQETPFDRGVVILNNNFDTVPPERFLGEENDGPMDIKATGHQLVLQHHFNNNWDLLAGIGYRDSSFEGFASEVELSSSRQLLYVDGETVTRFRRYRDYDATDLSGRVELSGTFITGSLKHHVLIGLDAYDYQLDSYQERWRTAFGTGDTTYSINLFNPVYGQVAPQGSPIQDNTEEQTSYGTYLQDQIDVSENWKVLLGLRVDKFEQDLTNGLTESTVNQKQTATSPRVGLVYEANDYITLYSSYAEGFRPNSGSDVNGTSFEPEESKSYEVGMKWATPGDVFTGTLAVYKAEKSNVLTSDPVNSGFSAALGEAESKGVELDITAALSDSTTLSAAYAYTDAYTANDVINADWGVAIPAGSKLINVAKNSANLTLRHFFELAGNEADIGASVNYVGERLGETIDPNYILPSYTLMRAFGSMQVSEKVKVMFDIDNLFDEEYYASSYSALWTMPGSPRNYRVSVSYQF
ncbi:TonB-dependent siderophore receptor [Paraglaciecola sp. 20A4]|uniref:TonB-dependent siderophore receptor n=1 Tax=Paraglaciecola sp. 20A4 TaxID=2687288 RepID=UPI00140844DD|nr:TonB-dependent siderophore receptor [Paraglaciecola sp. 20A4]